MKNYNSSIFLTFFLLLFCPFVFSQDAPLPESVESAIYALEADYDVEFDLYKKSLDDYRRISIERNASMEKLRELYSEMDNLLFRESLTVLSLLEIKELEIRNAEKESQALTKEGEQTRERIKEQLHRLTLLERKIAELKEALPKEEESITGNWDVTLLPGGDKGMMTLKQSGTIVSGQYHFEGGWKGSFQGTLIDRKIFLQRIDSKLGRVGEFEGYLSTDGKTMRGTWQNYELTATGDSTLSRTPAGSWAATRREE